jgi:hypothetical protein
MGVSGVVAPTYCGKEKTERKSVKFSGQQSLNEDGRLQSGLLHCDNMLFQQEFKGRSQISPIERKMNYAEYFLPGREAS